MRMTEGTSDQMQQSVDWQASNCSSVLKNDESGNRKRTTDESFVICEKFNNVFPLVRGLSLPFGKTIVCLSLGVRHHECLSPWCKTVVSLPCAEMVV